VSELWCMQRLLGTCASVRGSGGADVGLMWTFRLDGKGDVGGG